MPNWKKVITSGSDAALNSLYVTTAVTASLVSASAGLITDNIQFNTNTSTAVAVGQLAWNSSDGTLDLGMKGGNVIQQIGQDIFYEIRNETLSTIDNGTVLYANGVTAGSGRITAAPFMADGSVREVRLLGMATEDISNGVNGFVTHFGYVRGLDTRGNVASSIAVGDETWAAGNILYAHPTVAGKLTNVRPKHEISVAIIIVRHQNVGVVFVRPTSYGHLDDIHDVEINTGSLATGDLLIYDSGSDYWINSKQLSGSYGLTGSLSNGSGNISSGIFSHAEGSITTASGSYSHTEGEGTLATGYASHAEGGGTIAIGDYSHAEGGGTSSSGSYSHAEGQSTETIGYASHAEGAGTIATGDYSHTEGESTLATGYASHAEGNKAYAIGDYSHAEGLFTVASGSYQHVQGQYNISSSAQSAFIVGNGTGVGALRSNLIFAADSQVEITGSLVVTAGITGSLLGTASYATQALSASYAPSTPAFPYNGDAQISGSLGVTGSFSLQTFNGLTDVTAISFDGVTRLINDVQGNQSINADDRDLYDSANINSISWESRRLLDSAAVGSIRWDLRSAYDTVDSQSIAWGARLLKIDNGPGAYTVNWGSGILRDTGAKNSVDWENRQLKDSNGNENLNWSSGVSITGSLTVSGSSTFTNIGPAQFSGSFIVQGDLIPGSPPFIPDIGPYDAIKVDDITGQRLLYGSPFQGASASIDFGNRALYTSDGGDALSWSGQSGTYETFLYNQQYITETNRANLFAYNSYGGQTLGQSYFDTAVTDNDLVYLNTDGQWYQVDQTTNTSTKMLGIAKNVFSQTGSVVIEGDIVVTTATGYPAVANAGYGLPVYIKQGAGTVMDTAIPVSGYVRLLGHCYWNSGGGGNDEWIMKFRPSHEWIEL